MEIPYLIILVVFLASAIFCTFGFGDALLAMPFLSMIIGIQSSTPLLAMSGITLALLLLTSSYKHINLKESGKLVLGSLFGVPIGVWILKSGYEENLHVGFAILIIVIALYNLLKPRLKELHTDRYAPLFSFVGGVFGGAFNTSAPPVVMYGNMRRWAPVTFVGMMQAYFIPTDIFVIVGHLNSGLLDLKVFRLYLWCLPFLILAVIVGSYLKKRIPRERFYPTVFLIILFSGILLLIKSI